MTTIVGLVYHSGPEDLGACLGSIPASASVHVVVLDASPTGSAQPVIGERVDVTWVDGSRNAGYAWGLRQIAEGWLRTGDVFVAANSDIRFLPLTLSRLVAHAVELDGVCYPLQLDRNGAPAFHTLLHQLGLAESLARWWGVGRGWLRRSTVLVIQQAWLSGGVVRIPEGLCGSGAALVMTQTTWERIGGLDPDFFLFSEDKLLGTVLERLGVGAFLCADAPIIHEGGFRGRGVTSFGTTEAVVSEQLCWRKLMRSPAAVVVFIQIVGLILRLVACTILGRRARREAYGGALRYRLSHLSVRSAVPYGADHLRVAAWPAGRGTEHGPT